GGQRPAWAAGGEQRLGDAAPDGASLGAVIVLVPAAALAGAAFLVLVDLAARTIDQPAELPLTIVTAVFGVPFFRWLLSRRDREAVFGWVDGHGRHGRD
ncbi:MAG: iron chelate uptake ABC transporter family permease subunit, partial [Egibacteraceae bacterium]